MIADFLQAFHSLRAHYYQCAFSNQLFLDNQITGAVDGCSVLPGTLRQEVRISMHLSFEVAEVGSLNWALDIRSLQGPEHKGQFLVDAHCAANYGDEPYQTLVAQIFEGTARTDQELVGLVEEAVQKTIEHLRFHIEDRQLPALIEAGKTMPFYPGL